MEIYRYRYVDVKILCGLIELGEVSVGDRFKVRGSYAPRLLTEEVIFRLSTGKPTLYADTLINTKVDTIPELRYHVKEGRVTEIGKNKRGSKDYHKFLEEIIK